MKNHFLAISLLAAGAQVLGATVASNAREVSVETYYHPTSEVFCVELGFNSFQEIAVDVVDFMGDHPLKGDYQKVNSFTFKFDMTTFPPGIYLFLARNEDNKIINKTIISKN